MSLAAISNVLGVIILDEQGNVVIFDPFPRNASIVSKIFLDVKLGTANDHTREIVGSIVARLEDRFPSAPIEVDDAFLMKLFSSQGKRQVLFTPDNQEITRFRTGLEGNLKKIDDKLTFDEFHALNREVNLEMTRLQIKTVSEQNDKLIMQAVNAIDDLNKSTNIFAERAREWYGFHFPELTDQLIADHEFFLELIKEIGLRDQFTSETITEIRPVQEKTLELVMKRARESMGGYFGPHDITTLQTFARAILELYRARDEIETYVESQMEQTCPNLSAIVGPLIGARLICLAGGLEALAKKPSSTIQVLGAEKALFRAIRTKGEPPKHGVIFQAKAVRNAQFWQRGKVARLLAGKISIAVKVDQVSKRYIADDLLKDIDKKISEIDRKYPDKPIQKKKARPDNRGPHGRPYPPGRDRPHYPGKPASRRDFKQGPPSRYPKKRDDGKYQRPYNPKKQR